MVKSRRLLRLGYPVEDAGFYVNGNKHATLRLTLFAPVSLCVARSGAHVPGMRFWDANSTVENP